MLKVKWDIEEAVALYSLYIQCKIPIPKDRLKKLSLVLNNRANILGITVDEKFRNTAGLAMQASCIEYVVINYFTKPTSYLQSNPKNLTQS